MGGFVLIYTDKVPPPTIHLYGGYYVGKILVLFSTSPFFEIKMSGRQGAGLLGIILMLIQR